MTLTFYSLILCLADIDQMALLNPDMLTSLEDALLGMTSDSDSGVKDRSRQLRKQLEQYIERDAEDASP